MNIEDLTIGQVKEILKMAKSHESLIDKPINEMIGKYVICRCYSAGVHAGYLVSKNGNEVVLKNSRRLWSWGSNGGVALSGVAQLGMVHGKKVDIKNPIIELNGVIETILCSKIAEDSINGY